MRNHCVFFVGDYNIRPTKKKFLIKNCSIRMIFPFGCSVDSFVSLCIHFVIKVNRMWIVLSLLDILIWTQLICHNYISPNTDLIIKNYWFDLFSKRNVFIPSSGFSPIIRFKSKFDKQTHYTLNLYAVMVIFL